MNRREALSAIGWLMGGAVIGADLLVSCTSRPLQVNDLFNQDQITFLNEVSDTILPATSSPGAKDAKVGAFMAVMVQDCYTPEDQKVFMEGISQLDEQCEKKNGKKFLECDTKQRTAFLTALDEEQKQYMITKKEGDPNHYFRMMKELTLLGFFTSEEGSTKAMRYVAVPGRYDACVPYKKGDKAWATS
ncbi:gluconate 2-dehydrogenase subunit 3 family protein [Pontibacter silvestris]|uniref:Gluconate 2-dehydrogenase subunit 3 family protein n=1 Tax=Pontibacter silvestris TaxID=2305183 RepID=A0ABW4WZF6_9BACT|nr:gluconate 2-dehydrogenase subunit 3 family protein [Pontibacter silvestris]MCC9135216.1 gluconate 2-dehydrogenase subunit 3 family protein [Pontibacter silvestris]